MATIKNGYGGQTTSIVIDTDAGSKRSVGLWLNQDGIEVEQDRWTSDDWNMHRRVKSETLSYVTLDELIEIRDEINQAIKELAGV